MDSILRTNPLEPILVLTPEDVARIIGQWWKEHDANPERFRSGPDTEGEDSAATFFRIAGELGIG